MSKIASLLFASCVGLTALAVQPLHRTAPQLRVTTAEKADTIYEIDREELLAALQRIAPKSNNVSLPDESTLTQGETLIEVDYEDLLAALQRIAQQSAAPPVSKGKLAASDLLKYQMLLHLLQQKKAVRPIVVQVPEQQKAQASKNNKATATKNVGELLFDSELIALLQQIRHQTEQNSQKISDLQAQLSQSKGSNNTTRNFIESAAPLLGVAGDAAMLVSLQNMASETNKRLAAIEAQQQAIVAHLKGDVALADSLDKLPAPQIVTTVISPDLSAPTLPTLVQDTQQVPADFKRSVFFQVGTARLTPQSKATLNEATLFLKRFPKVVIDLQGFSSPEGNTARNQALSRARVAAVQEYLQSQGVSAQQLRHSDTGHIDKVSPPQVARRVDLSLIPPQ